MPEDAGRAMKERLRSDLRAALKEMDRLDRADREASLREEALFARRYVR